MSSLFQTWERLSVHGESGEGLIRLRLPEIHSAATYAAKSIAENLEAVIIEVATEAIPPKVDYPDARGFNVRADMLKPGRSGRTRLLLELTDGRYRDVFLTLADDVVGKLAETTSEAEAVRVFIVRLSRWQSFLRRHGATGLSQEARRGLLGELVLLRDFVLPHTEEDMAIASWKGCRGANHDFQFRTASVEVKATSSSTPHAFHVSNIKQLDQPGQGRLFVFFVLLEESEGGDVSLPEVVDRIRDRLDGTARDAFEDCLIEAGYLEAQRELYLSPRYTVRRHRFFGVAEGFPRLREGQLPGGVEGVKYQVAIAACESFEVFESDVLDAIFERVEDGDDDG